MEPAKPRNYGCRIKDNITYQGMRCLYLENRFLKVGLLLDKGSDIFEFLYKPLDMDMVWLSPAGIQNPQRFSLTKSQPAGRFMDIYEGGWQEIFPNGGGACSYQGVQWGQHEEAALLPWDYSIIEDEPEQIKVELYTETRLMPFKLVKILTLKQDGPTLFIQEQATNLSPEDLKIIWGHHLVYGNPFLQPGCRINIGAKKGLVYQDPQPLDENIEPGIEFSWPHLPVGTEGSVDISLIPGQDAKTAKFLYLSGLDEGRYEIINDYCQLKVAVEWNLDTMPYVWYWQEFNKSRGYPWYGRSRVLGLEPFSTDSMGLDNTVARGRDKLIKARSSLDNYINITVDTI